MRSINEILIGLTLDVDTCHSWADPRENLLLQLTNDRCRHRPRDQIIFLPTLGKQFLKSNRQQILALRVKTEIFFRRLLRRSRSKRLKNICSPM